MSNINDIELTSDTIEYLELLIEKGRLDLDNDNVHVKFLKELGYIDLHLIIPSYITPSDKGIQFLKLYKQKSKENFRDTFWRPISVNLVSWAIIGLSGFIIGLVIGWIARGLR